tara:strand:+ start:132 stop:374 length:243 start_codon:yes stop_codon:yes gene_type:complete
MSFSLSSASRAEDFSVFKTKSDEVATPNTTVIDANMFVSDECAQGRPMSKNYGFGSWRNCWVEEPRGIPWRCVFGLTLKG